MDVVRLGDRINWITRKDPEREPLVEAEYIAQQVFDPQADQTAVTQWYVQSQPPARKRTYPGVVPEGAPQLGRFESQLVHKLLFPKRPVICVQGQVGCGKTTVKNYVALHLVAGRCHTCNRCGANHRRLVAQIDFNDHLQLNDTPPDSLMDVTSQLLCKELRARLIAAEVLTGDEEFAGFWAYEISRFQTGVSLSKAFRAIIVEAGSIEPLKTLSPSTDEVNRRRDLLARIEGSPELHLDYLLRLWQYLISNHYNGNRGCAFVILDNIDRVAPAVQRRVLDAVLTNAKQHGPTFVLFTRPETTARVGLAVSIVDRVPHKGPTPFQVVTDRWERFCQDPGRHFDPSADLERATFDTLTGFLRRLLAEVRGGNHRTFQNFLSHASGGSVRLGLMIAQNLFYLSPAILNAADISINAVVRACVRGRVTQLAWTPTHAIEHLFRVSDEGQGDRLVKPRVLRYLGRHSKSPRRLNEIYNQLMGFGYPTRLIQRAVNDLMQLSHQLIRSDGFDFYYEPDVLEKFAGHAVMLTEIGSGYSQYLMRDIGYIQEVMLDTFVSGDRFRPGLRFGFLREKFSLLVEFLDELRVQDCQETKQFVEKFTLQAYFESFGEHLISLDIIQGVYPSSMRILDTAEARAPERTPSYKDVVERLTSLVLVAENDNKEILGIWPVSVVEAKDKGSFNSRI